MKINRWIFFPLIHVIFIVSLTILLFYLFGLKFNSVLLLVWLLYALLMAFLMLYFTDRKARKTSKFNDSRVFEIRQYRALPLLLDKEKTFNLCREAMLSQKNIKILKESFINGEIKGINRSIKENFIGEQIDIHLTKLNDNLTEVEVFVRPAWKTVIVSRGQTWKIAEEICKYLNEKDAEINKKVLADSAVILDDVYVKPFQKEKVER